MQHRLAQPLRHCERQSRPALRHGRDNRYHLFDPNYFHVAIKGADTFKSFVDSYLRRARYDTQFEAKTGVVGIKPPINGGG